MIDKYRLEEIKKHRDEAENSIDEYEFEKINFYNLHVDWLIEQAERVHGKNNLIGLAGMYEDCNRMVANLTSQNKRYREALERIARINIEQGTVTISEVQAVLLARKALEESK